MEIHAIFPYPIGITHLPRDFSKSELNFFNKELENFEQNIGNYMSINQTILDAGPMKKLKTWLLNEVKDYINEWNPPLYDTVQPYITYSWMTLTKKGEFHHAHYHPNSYVSGVLYIEADALHDKIIFEPPIFPTISYNPKKWTLYNSEEWFFTTQSKQLLLFPSNLRHSVKIKTQDTDRIALAFNTFLKGPLGHGTNNQLNGLNL
jgi:uncharacterized protein (TIGR02466 family)